MLKKSLLENKITRRAGLVSTFTVMGLDGLYTTETSSPSKNTKPIEPEHETRT